MRLKINTYRQARKKFMPKVRMGMEPIKRVLHKIIRMSYLNDAALLVLNINETRRI